jgi:hypothetical protein
MRLGPTWPRAVERVTAARRSRAPNDLAGEAQVLRWSVAALSSIEVPVLTMWFAGISGGKGTKPHEALQKWSDMRLNQLDGWLANSTLDAYCARVEPG